VGLFGVHDHQRAIVQNKPFILVTHGNHSMSRLVFDVAYDLELQVSKGDSGFLECDIFCDGVIFTIARSTAQGLKRGRLVVFNAVLSQITHRSYA
jgi:hypothetical protein